MRGLSPVKIWMLGLTAVFIFLCGGVFLAGNAAGGDWQVTTSRGEEEKTASSGEEENWPVSLLPGEQINLNTAAAKDLARLPQIGEKRAQSIVAWREEHGPFRTTEELMQVSGIGEGIFAQIEIYITVDDTE